MADRGDTHYSLSSLNLWFAISSILLMLSFVWMMLDDHQRPWKRYQREFRDLEVARAEADKEALEAQGALQTEAELEAQVAAAEENVAQRQDALDEAQDELRLLRGDLWSATEAAKKVKSQYNFERWAIEVERIGEGDPELEAQRIAELERRMNETAAEQERHQLLVDAAQAEVDGMTRELDEAIAALAAGTRDLDRVRGRLDQLDPQALDRKVANLIRDEVPGLDFIGPTLQVNKVVLDNLTFELNFTKKKRIDMCHTCHLGIDRDGYQEEEQPFTSHPRLDLYLSSKSPHPLKDFGCTICHRGAGEALDFVRADHRPSDAEEGAEWFEEYHWHKQHHWDYPMLASDFTEASCVQCHKTSMELIQDDAPRVSEGFQLFERYGCYACHKVDWFPEDRRPGPTLTNLRAKLTPEFVASWVGSPKAFRPTTWMPQVFHLENYAPDEVVVASEYGSEDGRDILGQEWNDAAVAAVTAYVFDRAPEQDLPPVPVTDGDAHRGREVFRVAGCLACHNMAPYGTEEPDTNDLALRRRGENEHGPNLRGVATKLNAEWLFWWLKDPASYWPETRMPNLRLEDQEVADIVAYMMEDPDGIFTDVPEGWVAQDVQMPEDQMMEVLGEQARWFFARDGRERIKNRLAGTPAANQEDASLDWSDPQNLKVAVGEKLVAHYGCFSCHEIDGMRDMMPIGVELSNWGSKTVDKLDFGFGAHLFGLDPSYREGWLMQKLHAPRSYDQQKVKNPSEKLRMPWFDFSDEEVRSIATFVVGLVDDEVQRAKMEPEPIELAMNDGLRSVRQNNCMACHMIDPGTITYLDEDGVERTVAAELTGTEDDPMPPEHTLEGILDYAERYELDEIGLRVLRPEPDVGLDVGGRVFVAPEDVVSVTSPRGGDLVRLITDYYFYGIEAFDPEAESEDDAYYYLTGDPDDEGRVQDVDGEWRAYYEEPYGKVRWTYAPPVLWNEGHKVQRQWFYGFLNDVVPLRPQIRVRMPSFHYGEGDAGAIADYFAAKSAREWPTTYTRKLRLDLGLTAEELAEASGAPVYAVRGIEGGNQMDVAANFSRVLAYGNEQGFSFHDPVNPSYESTHLRSRAYLADRAAEQPDHLQLGEKIAVDVVNCFQCHYRLGQPPSADPIAWAPDLALTHERLREDWVRAWLTDPQSIYPETSMPANFAGDPPQYQDVFPDSTNDEQIDVVMDWLFNFDRVYMGGGTQ